MAQTKNRRNSKSKTRVRGPELDRVYLLKLILYLIVGAQWIRLQNSAGTTTYPVPVGLIIGIFFAMHDHFRIDRKIEFAVLLVAMFVGFWSQVGAYITY